MDENPKSLVPTFAEKGRGQKYFTFFILVYMYSIVNGQLSTIMFICTFCIIKVNGTFNVVISEDFKLVKLRKKFKC